MRCDVCNKDLERQPHEAGSGPFVMNAVIGVQISIRMPPDDAYMQRQMGPYSHNKEYNVCYECWLRSMGVKP